MDAVLERKPDFSQIPVMPDDVFTAPLKRPAHVGEDWLEPKQTEYDSEDDRIWDDLFARQMDGRRPLFSKGWSDSTWARAAYPNSASCPSRSTS